jgi:hypothetical protein
LNTEQELYEIDNLFVGLTYDGVDNWTTRIWRRHAHLGIVFNTFSYANAAARDAASLVIGDVGKYALQLDNYNFYKLTAAPNTWELVPNIWIPWATNPYGGFDWTTNLIWDAGYGPVEMDFPGGGVAHYNQRTESQLRLLGPTGSTLKQSTAITEMAFDYDGIDTTEELRLHEDFVYDTNGPEHEFWGIRMALTLRDTPTDNVLNNEYFFILYWIIGQVL